MIFGEAGTLHYFGGVRFIAREMSLVKILLIADAWMPYVSGFVRTFSTMVEHLAQLGHEVNVITPYMFRRIPFPLYPQFPLPVFVKGKMFRSIEQLQPDAIHIGAEGPLGMAARRWCLRNNFPFTTSFTTKAPEYFNAWCGVPVSLGYQVVRRFHQPSSAIMISTPTVKRELENRGFKNLAMWTRGVNLELFRPRPEPFFLTDPRPISLYVGRVAKEKNIPAFLDLDLPGTKYVVGNGPLLKALRKKYPHVQFVGEKVGEELARYYAAANVLVFPSRTDTFGLVILEALASGTPVAAYPVTGPIDVIGDCDAAALDENLGQAVRRALTIDRSLCRPYAEQFSWERSAQQFLENLHPEPSRKSVEKSHAAFRPGHMQVAKSHEKRKVA